MKSFRILLLLLASIIAFGCGKEPEPEQEIKLDVLMLNGTWDVVEPAERAGITYIFDHYSVTGVNGGYSVQYELIIDGSEFYLDSGTLGLDGPHFKVLKYEDSSMALEDLRTGTRQIWIKHVFNL